MISFVVLCHNEGDFLKKCIPNIEKTLRDGDEIIIVDDMSTDENTVEYLSSLSHKVVFHSLNGDFSSHRNHAHQFCKNKYIFMIDADEIMTDVLSLNIHEIISSNPEVDLFLVPRLNVVEGFKHEDAMKWGWRVTKEPGFDETVINFPDYQHRIYKNSPDIQWKGRLHERPSGYSRMAPIPADPDLCLIHRKTIKRQTEQNTFYNQNFTENENRGIHR